MGIDPGGKAYVAENMQKKMMDILGPLGYYEGKRYNQAEIDRKILSTLACQKSWQSCQRRK